MRRTLFTIVACTALLAAVPATALAHGHRDHHRRHHHSRVRHEKFLAHRHDSTSTGTPTPGSEPTAGTVTSFANNVLTITLTNGNTVSGDVTNDTEVKCENPAEDNNGNNDVEHGDLVSDHGPGGSDAGSNDQGDDNGNDQGDDNGNDQGDDNGNDQMCTITPGMAVKKAELTISGAGAVWDEVELLSSTSTSPTSTSSRS